MVLTDANGASTMVSRLHHEGFTKKGYSVKNAREMNPFGLRMPPDMKAWIEAQADKERMSMNSWLLRLIDKEKEKSEAVRAQPTQQ